MRKSTLSHSWPHLAIVMTAIFISALTLGPSRVLAHGSGLPEPIDVTINPSTGDAALLWSTYGVMVPRGPQDWRWICEEVAGGSATVTAFASLGGSRMLMGTGVGLYTTEDLCDWSPHQDIPTDLDVLAIEGGSNALYLAAFKASAASGGSLYRSVDGARSFVPYLEEVFGPKVGILGFVLNDAGVPAFATVYEYGEGPDESPTMAMYWGLGGEGGEALGGAGSPWRRFPLDLSAGNQGIALGMVERGGEVIGFGSIRTGEGDIFVRLLPTGEVEPLVDLIPIREFVSDFAVGSTPGTLWMAAPKAGLYRSEDWGETWAPYGAQGDGYCVVPLGKAVYRCANEWFDGAAVLREGAGLGSEVAFSFGWVRGPLSCPEGSSVARQCEALWQDVKDYGFDAPTPTAEPTPIEDGEEGGCSGGDTKDASLVAFPLALAYLGRRQRKRAPIKNRAS